MIKIATKIRELITSSSTQKNSKQPPIEGNKRNKPTPS